MKSNYLLLYFGSFIKYKYNVRYLCAVIMSVLGAIQSYE